MVGCVLQRQGNEDRSRKTYHRPIYSYTTVDSDVFHQFVFPFSLILYASYATLLQYSISTNVSAMSLMESKQDIFGECRMKFVQTFKTSCMYWLPVQFLNFLLIPPALRVSFVSIAAFCWVNILCYLKSVPLTECNNNSNVKY